MDNRQVTFSVQMTANEIYRFMMYHVYHSFSGIFGICLSLAAFFVLVFSFDSLTDQSKTILTFVAVWFTLIDPVILWVRSKGQVKRNKAYQKPLSYQLDEEGITVSQEEERQTIAWDALMKIVETKSQYQIYSSRVHAFIFPKKAVGENCAALEEVVLYYAAKPGIPLKGAIRKKKHKKTSEKEG